jgi:steroid 5-alpha reductase family enzyme
MSIYLLTLAVLLGTAVLAWSFSLFTKDVSFVDSLWSIFFLIAAVVFATSADTLSVRGMIVLLLVAIWSIRLSLHITVRNWGEEEDHRYQAIRKNNSPNFQFKSLYIVFGLQAVLAWIIAAPLNPAITGTTAMALPDLLAIALWTVGFIFEAVGDSQLKAFKGDSANKGKVLDTGLWRYTRHPNYFGEFCIWWAYWLFAFAAGAWWTVFAPLLMSFLLLKVSGVAMLEKTISNRRPKYAEYIRRTNAFFPGPSRAADMTKEARTS